MASALLDYIANPQVANPGKAYAQGQSDGFSLWEMGNQRQAQELFPSAMSGDARSLAELGRYAPKLALDLDQRTYDRARQSEVDARARAAEGRAQATFDRSAASERAGNIASLLVGADTPEKFAQAVQFMKTTGLPIGDNVTFENRDFLIRQAMGLADSIKAGADLNSLMGGAQTPDYMTVKPGDAVFDKNTGQFVSSQGMPPPLARPPSVTTQKAILEADEAINAGEGVIGALDRALELNKGAMSGFGASQLSYVGSLFGNETATNTQELKNLVTAQALDQLKATFGAMPTEGERKILLEIQGSVDQPPEVRRRIFERAKAAAQRRIDFNRERAKALRSGTYYGPQDEGQPEAGGGVPDGIDPADWEYMSPEDRALWQQ